MEWFKWSLRDHPSQNAEYGGVEGDFNYCRPAGQDVSEGKNFSMWPRDCSCNILVKNVTAFCPFLGRLPEFKVKKFTLLALRKEVSKKPSTGLLS